MKKVSAQQKWNHKHLDKMAETQKRFRKKNPQVVRRSNLKRYGLTPESFEAELVRQHRRCLGCRASITERTACVDHDHLTNTFRGLLCMQCNWALGNVRDDKATLRRLMTYLDYDRTKINLYVIGRLKNPEIQSVSEVLRGQGYDVMDDWYAAGPDADDCWQKYEGVRGRSYAEALKGRAAQNVFLFDKSHLDLSDAAVLVLPAGKSAHLEMGYMRGCEKPVFILIAGDVGRYEVMPNFASAVCQNQQELLEALEKEFGDRR